MRITALIVAGLVLVAPVSAQAPRPGAELRFAMLDDSGGMEGSTFLPIAPSDVRVRARDATCPSARVEIRARGLRGLVRDLRITMPDVSSPGELLFGTTCDQVGVRAKMEDGAEITEGNGSMRVTEVHREGAVRLVLDFTWSARTSPRRTLPIQAHVVVPAPPAP